MVGAAYESAYCSNSCHHLRAIRKALLVICVGGLSCFDMFVCLTAESAAQGSSAVH